MTRKRVILIADDNEGIVALLKTLCETAGYLAMPASDGTDALQKARHFNPDLVLMDGLMPGMSGFEATRALRAERATSHIPIIILTALQGREDRLKGISAGANDFLTKPIDSEELLLRVKNCLELKDLHDLLADHNVRLEQQVAERTRDLREALNSLEGAHRETIIRLAIASEYKDESTGAHIKRIGSYCMELATALGLSPEVQEQILYSSAMHDIGKVHIPDAILLKPGKLSPEEWEVMRGHTLVGEKILEGSQSPYLQMARLIAAAHHEHWDGTGYPRGLRENQIPIEARITSVADQYDALRMERPYKHGMRHDATREVLTRGDGRTCPTHFDPAVLDAFLACEAKFQEIFSTREDSLYMKDWKAVP